MPNEKDETDGTRTVLGILSITRVNSHSSDSDWVHCSKLVAAK
jgi:hypothetical protein